MCVQSQVVSFRLVYFSDTFRVYVLWLGWILYAFINKSSTSKRENKISLFLSFYSSRWGFLASSSFQLNFVVFLFTFVLKYYRVNANPIYSYAFVGCDKSVLLYFLFLWLNSRLKSFTCNFSHCLQL